MPENNSPEERPATVVIQQQEPKRLRAIGAFVVKHYLKLLLTGGGLGLSVYVVSVTQTTVEAFFEVKVSKMITKQLKNVRACITQGASADLGQIMQAVSPTFVNATMRASKKEYTVLCGYVSDSRKELETRSAVTPVRAGASAHYGFETDAPVSSLSMLVEQGRFWMVDYCPNEKRLRATPEVFFNEIRLAYDVSEEAETQ